MTSTSAKIHIAELSGTPLGDLRLAASEAGLLAVEWADASTDLDKYLRRFGRSVEPNARKLRTYLEEVGEYLTGNLRKFSFKIDWSSLRPFLMQAMQAVYTIPYGETRTYGQIAAQIGRPRASRAVGRANAANPMPLVIPCHRVIGSDGKLHGYGGGAGLPTKEWLLKMEGALLS
jgi:methylated-DNA-[protein]-cysteine S-methyltransferase